MAPDVAGRLERREQSARERTCKPDDIWLYLVHRLLDAGIKRRVNDAAAADQLLETAEIVDRRAKVLGITRKAETGIDIIAYPDRQFVYQGACVALRLERRRALKKLDKNAMEKLGLKVIPADDIYLKPELLK